MKKRILAILTCVLLLMGSISVTAFADEPKGSITIQNPTHSDATVAGKQFQVYKVFNATSSGNNTSYSWYEVDGEIPFYDFFYGPAGVVNVNKENGNVMGAVEYLAALNSGGNNFELSQVAEKMHKYIVEKNIEPVAKPAPVEAPAASITVPNLGYGYYLVYDDTELTGGAVRSAVMLTTVNKDAVITLKANRPQILKEVKENNGEFGKGTSVSIGDIVTFKITTAVPSHTLYTDYIYYIEDIMHDGLALKADTIKVYKNGVELQNGDFELVTTGLDTNVDFKVDFSTLMNDENKYEIGDELTIVYDAKVTNAIEAQKANKNTAELNYSNDPTSTTIGSVSDDANVYSYQFVFTKFAQDSKGVLTNVRLSGAEFQLYRVVENGPDKLVTFTTEEAMNNENVKFTKYIVADNGSGVTDTLVVQDIGAPTITLDHINMGGHLGDIFIFGLAEGKYKLVETKAPDGYVLPDTPFELEIVDEIGALGSVSTLNVSGKHTGSGSIVNTNGMGESILTVWAEITNKPGTALPETGGAGTALYTILGVILMAGAAAYLFMRRKKATA